MNLHPKGLSFVRFIIAKTLARTPDGQYDIERAFQFAQERWGQRSPPQAILKAEISALHVGGGAGAALTSDYGAAAGEFMSVVRERSILGQLAGIRRIPAYVPYLLATGTAVASWVPEGKSFLFSSQSWERSQIAPLKLQAGVPMTKELLQSGDPQAELQIRNDLINVLAEAFNLALIDPTNAGVADEKPASVTYDQTAVSVGANDMREAVLGMIQQFDGDLLKAVFVGSPRLYAQLADPLTFPSLGVRGGEILGIPAVASNMPDDGNDYQLALIDPTNIIFTGSDLVEIDVARHASVQLLNNPTGVSTPNPQETQLVSLWQHNAVAIRTTLDANWRLARGNSVMLTGIAKEGQIS